MSLNQNTSCALTLSSQRNSEPSFAPLTTALLSGEAIGRDAAGSLNWRVKNAFHDVQDGSVSLSYCQSSNRYCCLATAESHWSPSVLKIQFDAGDPRYKCQVSRMACSFSLNIGSRNNV